jgi:hypothetical protein
MVQSGGDEADWGLVDALAQRKTTTMQRRNLLIGMGSLAAGGAATIGTGAVSLVTTDRDVTVATTGDDSAYLGMVPDSEYATLNSGELALTFDKLNQDANTGFRNVFYLKNNGSNELRVQLTDGDSSTGISYPNASPLVVSYSDSRLSNTAYPGQNVFPNSPNWLGDTGYGHSGPDSADAITGFLDLAPGDTAAVHFDFFLKSDGSDSDTNTNVSGEVANSKSGADIPTEIGFYASAVPESGPL